jgi:hypothetical protein
MLQYLSSFFFSRERVDPVFFGGGGMPTPAIPASAIPAPAIACLCFFLLLNYYLYYFGSGNSKRAVSVTE